LEALDIMGPFQAYLLKGARFLKTPLFKYRVHSNNTSHSLIYERLQGTARLEAAEHMHYLHLAHALYMQDLIRKIKADDPARYSPLAERIEPLLQSQLEDMARRLVNTRVALIAARREMAPAEDRRQHAVA
jgi:hypothetical protein